MRNFSRSPTACSKPPCTAPITYLAANPQFASLVSTVSGTQSNGTMAYNALQVVLQQHVSHGLEYQVAYTYSKCMSNNTGYYGSWGAQATTGQPYWQNIYDPKPNGHHAFTTQLTCSPHLRSTSYQLGVAKLSARI